MGQFKELLLRTAVPRVTVGMPVFNRAHVLKETIDQVLNQSFTDYEFIIYNDGSHDVSADIIRTISDERIIFLDRPNLGPPHPLNAILQQARGEFIIILHDHDFFDAQLLEKSVAALEKYPDAGFVLQGSAWIDEDGVSNYREMLHDLPELNDGRALGRKLLSDRRSFSSIFHACCMVRAKHHEAVGKFYNTEYGLYADTDLWFRLLSKFDFVYLKEVLFKFRTREIEGHFLRGKEYQILASNCAIHKTNLPSFYTGSALASMERLADRKYKRSLLPVIFQKATNRELKLFADGVEILIASGDNRLLTPGFWLNTIKKRPRVAKAFCNALYITNSLRKKIKG